MHGAGRRLRTSPRQQVTLTNRQRAHRFSLSRIAGQRARPTGTAQYAVDQLINCSDAVAISTADRSSTCNGPSSSGECASRAAARNSTDTAVG